MSDKVVLPKFDLPGDRTPAAIKVVWAVGGVLLLCFVGLGLLVMNRHQQQLAAERRQEAIVAARLAEANAATEAAKARAAEAAARVAAARAATEKAKIEAKMAAAAARNPPAVALASNESGTGAGRHGRHHFAATKAAATKAAATKAGSKPLAKAGPADDKKSAAKSTSEKRDDAAIDKLLASFNKK